MQDALISPESFAILSGAGLLDASEDEPAYVHMYQKIEVKEPNTIVLPEEACWNKYDSSDPYYQRNADIFVMTLTNGQIDSEPCVPYSVDDDRKTITCYSHAGQIDAGDIVLVDWYVKRTSNVKTIEITPDQFGGYYYIEASCLFRDDNTGVDMPAEFIIPKAKVQSNFTFSMASSGDPSVFDFVMDAFPDYVKFKESKKVLAAIQVVTDKVDESTERREACRPQTVTSLTDGVSVSFDNDSTEDNCKLTVSGNNVDGTHYDTAMWGDVLNNAAELEIVMPVYENGKYRLKTQNPMLKHYYPGDATLENGVYIKNKVYDIEDGSLTLRTAVTDDKGAIYIELYKIDGDVETLVKTFSIDNQVNFLKFYDVRIDNQNEDVTITKYEKLVGNEYVAMPSGFTGEKVTTGIKIRLTLSDLATVTANGTLEKIKEDKSNKTYTMTVGNIGGKEFVVTIK